VVGRPVDAEAVSTRRMGEAAGAEEAPARGQKPEELDEQGRLATALDAISCLVSDSVPATLFPLKWQLIRDRLNRLHAGLADITLTADDTDARCDAFADLLRGVAATARAGSELVPRSQGRSYGGGKLRLRSDLDVLSASLDAHAAALDEVHASGALARSRALVVPRPPPGAPRDDVRFYARHLLARLRVGGGAEARAEVAAALNEALRAGDEKHARVVASELLAAADGVGVLVAMLECDDAHVQEEALDAVSVIAGLDAHRADLVVGGVVAPVVRVLDSGASQLTREGAARVLCRLTDNSDNAWAVAAHGGVMALLNACTDSSSSGGGGELACAACRVLRNLAGVDEIRKYMVSDAGAVPVLVSLSHSATTTSDTAQIQATELLATMSASDGSVRDAIIQSGAIESLVRTLSPTPPSSSKSRKATLRAIDALCLSSASPPVTARLLASGFLPRVLALLRDADAPTLQHCALKATRRLCHVSEEARRAAGDAGLMQELAGVLARAKSPEAREAAAEVLCAVVAVHRNRRRFVQEDRGGVAGVMRALRADEEKPSPTTRFLLVTLAHLADSRAGRRKIVSSEQFKYGQPRKFCDFFLTNWPMDNDQSSCAHRLSLEFIYCK
jgi:hypothetical protein